jgi:hypothetical protein
VPATNSKTRAKRKRQRTELVRLVSRGGSSAAQYSDTNTYTRTNTSGLRTGRGVNTHPYTNKRDERAA